MSSQDNDDQQLIDELSVALDRADPVPDDVLAAARAAFLTRDLDRELAELVYDSERDEQLIATRGDNVRSMSFATEQLVIEIEVHVKERLIVGSLAPAQRASVELEIDGLSSHHTSTDEFGRFRLSDVPPGPLSLICRSSIDSSPDAETTSLVCTVGFEF